MDIKEIRSYLAENRDKDEVKSFIAEFEKPPTVENVTKFLKTDEGEKLLQPIVDRRVTGALKTAEEPGGSFEKKLTAALEEQRNKLNPKETETDKQLRLIQKELAESKAKAAQAELNSAMIAEAQKIGVHDFSDLLPVLNVPSLESGREVLTKIKGVLDARLTKQANELLTGTGFRPGGGNGGAPRADVSKMSKEDVLKLEMEGKLDALLTK